MTTSPARVKLIADALAPIAIAVALDARFGEPPVVAHPVRATGRLLDRLGTLAPARPAARARRRGAIAWAVGLAVTVIVARVVDAIAARQPAGAAVLLRGAALWPLVSLRMLVDETVHVERALARDLESGRTAVSRLVSRPTDGLDATQVREAAISSLAENIVDGWTAPLVWHAIGGLTGAAAYRFVNTADAMWGHRDDRWRRAGSAAAVADDVANVVPARITGAILASKVVPTAALRDDARRTPSPNGGWPMAAIARQLGIRLSKPGVYVLNPHGRDATRTDTFAAIRLVRGCAWRSVATWSLVRLVVVATRRRACRR